MKKLIFLLFIVLLNSCTWDFNADLDTTCPCVVNRITKTDKTYLVRVNEINSNYMFQFKTQNEYHIGDTIK